jgi:hypothetical protein
VKEVAAHRLAPGWCEVVPGWCARAIGAAEVAQQRRIDWRWGGARWCRGGVAPGR